jgi:hypothetical protein
MRTLGGAFPVDAVDQIVVRGPVLAEGQATVTPLVRAAGGIPGVTIAARDRFEVDMQLLIVEVTKAMGASRAGVCMSAAPGRGRYGRDICDHGVIGALPGTSAGSHRWVRRHPTR